MVESVSVEVTGGGDTPVSPYRVRLTPPDNCRLLRRPCTCSQAGRWHETPLYQRADTVPGHVIAGPAIIAEANATTVS